MRLSAAFNYFRREILIQSSEDKLKKLQGELKIEGLHPSDARDSLGCNYAFHGSRNIKPELVFRIHATLRAHEVNRFEFTKGAKQMRLMSWCNVEMQHKAGGLLQR